MPKISIIVPVFNVRPYIDECLESIQAQTFKDFEVILVDDGSTDGSGQACDWFAFVDRRFKVIHKENGGVSSARNAALHMATGEFFGFIDPDDRINAVFYERMMKAIEEHEADMAISDLQLIQANGGKYPIPPILTKRPDKRIVDDILLAYTIQDGTTGEGMVDKLFHHSLLDGVTFPESISLLEDGAILPAILCKANKAIVEPDAIYYYRRRDNSLTSRKLNIDRLSEFYDASEMEMKTIAGARPDLQNEAEFLNTAHKIMGLVRLFTKE